MVGLQHALDELDARFVRLRDEQGIPGIAWGVVVGDELVRSGGAGTTRDGDVRIPDADAVFRIASMTKSFTAATVLLLRDEGRVRLDDPVAAYVPELDGWRSPTADSPPVTVRQLLTMSAGLATDDPWGDRQQALDLGRFAALLAEGPSFAWPPGTAFEYSNLGYGILGRVITNVAGREYREVVTDRLLAPLGMTATTYLEDDIPDDRRVHGYVRRDDVLVREGIDGYGALAAMGGLFTSVRDLARWVSGFLDAFPARDEPDDRHPLRRATRREMQQLQRAFTPEAEAHHPGDAPRLTIGGYGFGLFVTQDPELGTMIGHGGGYPGFGSHMAWHPATGLGVIAFGNLRYAPVHGPARDALAALVRAGIAPRRRITVRHEVDALRPVVEGLLERWDDGVADEAFAMNMDLDQPRSDRRAAAARVVEGLGRLRPDAERRPSSDSPADVTWWLRGDSGSVRVSILVSPEPRPRIQRLDLRRVGDPSPALLALAERILDLAAGTDPTWPADLPLGDIDRAELERALRAATPRLGALSLGFPVDGDGTTTATWELRGERQPGELRLRLDPETGALAEVRLLVRPPDPPAEAW
jgi:CubicO group peptidase (beta-lactamase class C family)